MGGTLAGKKLTSVEVFSDAGFVAEEDEKLNTNWKSSSSRMKKISPPQEDLSSAVYSLDNNGGRPFGWT